MPTLNVSVGIARELGWEPTDIRVLEIAALLHDIGKIGVPDTILRKPGKLSPDEAEVVAVHHNVGLAVLQACRVHISVVEMIARASRVGIRIEEAEVPVRPEVQGACELLGFDPLYVACEGRFIAVVPAAQEEKALAALLALPEGAQARRIGRVTEEDPGKVVAETDVDREMVVGRKVPADIVVAHTEVSGRHAQLRSAPDGLVVTDLGSTNGSSIDGAPKLAPNTPVTLKPGQKLPDFLEGA